jgi:hypothetical protein
MIDPHKEDPEKAKKREKTSPREPGKITKEREKS